MEKLKCIGTRRHARANALGKAPKDVGKAFDPNVLVGAAHEVTVFVHVASSGVYD